MTRHAFVVLATALLIATPARAQERASVLGGVSFGTHPATVATKLSSLGLAPSPLIASASAFPFDQAFEGSVNGRHVLVIVMFDAGQSLEKMAVSFITADNDCLRVYRDVKASLTRQFGATHATVEEWAAPYDRGRHDGHEEAAIRSGKGVLGASWDCEDAGDIAAVSLAVDRSLTVTLTYESSAWPRELERRHALLRVSTSKGGE